MTTRTTRRRQTMTLLARVRVTKRVVVGRIVTRHGDDDDDDCLDARRTPPKKKKKKTISPVIRFKTRR